MEMHIHPQDVLDALRKVRDLSSQRDIVALGYVKDIEVTGEGRVAFVLQLPSPSSPSSQQLIQAAHDAVRALGVANVQIQLTASASSTRPTGPAGQTGTMGAQSNLIPEVKYTIAVASGKGGVGKSTVATNLAIALMRAGNQVGLMDTDVYGPSVPILMGGSNEPHVVEGKIEPPVEYGVKIISMAYFLPKDEAVIWRGPMLHKTIQQFLGEVRWGALDYLVIDLPPGTGDIQLSLSQTIPLSGAVIVSTPQDLALTVASKAIAMFQKLHVPILGVVENMSTYVCPQCGHQESIFGHGGARAAAAKMGFAFLGEIPLDTRIRTQSDAGKPVALDDTTPYGKPFAEIAAALEAEVAKIRTEEKIEIE